MLRFLLIRLFQMQNVGEAALDVENKALPALSSARLTSAALLRLYARDEAT
jgi:hypothetical protein